MTLMACQRSLLQEVPGNILIRQIRLSRWTLVYKLLQISRINFVPVDTHHVFSIYLNLYTVSDPIPFSTQNASGSTSQAANVVEAVETGCRLYTVSDPIPVYMGTSVKVWHHCSPLTTCLCMRTILLRNILSI